MLIAITLALTLDADATLPGHLGRANYAATLQRLAAVDAGLAAAVHDGDGPKPLTCSSVLNAPAVRQELHLRRGERYYVRITGLHAPISHALEAGFLHDRPAAWELANHLFRVEDVSTRGDETDRAVHLQFASPTAFKSGGMTVPVPMPGFVFGSLVERWNAFSPITLSPDMRRFGEEVMAISHYNLRSVPVAQKDKGLRIGGIGDVTYRALSSDRYWIGVMHMLADFAPFSGVGVQTATGMGQVRKISR
jgi:CRISPR-associated endoribonuclease Cas6